MTTFQIKLDVKDISSQKFLPLHYELASGQGQNGEALRAVLSEDGHSIIVTVDNTWYRLSVDELIRAVLDKHFGKGVPSDR